MAAIFFGLIVLTELVCIALPCVFGLVLVFEGFLIINDKDLQQLLWSESEYVVLKNKLA